MAGAPFVGEFKPTIHIFLEVYWSRTAAYEGVIKVHTISVQTLPHLNTVTIPLETQALYPPPRF